jgi:predicted HAD superfamily phosphohydrolase YqeG
MMKRIRPIEGDVSSIPAEIPHYIAASVLDIDFAELATPNGAPHVVFDLDLTLRRPWAKRNDPDVEEYLLDQKQAGYIDGVSIATRSSSPMSPFAARLEANVFQGFNENGERVRKPDPRFFAMMLGKLGLEASQAVMVGDMSTIDIAPANAIGMTTVLVPPLGGRDYWFDTLRAKRWRDNRALSAALQIMEQLDE